MAQHGPMIPSALQYVNCTYRLVCTKTFQRFLNQQILRFSIWRSLGRILSSGGKEGGREKLNSTMMAHTAYITGTH